MARPGDVSRRDAVRRLAAGWVGVGLGAGLEAPLTSTGTGARPRGEPGAAANAPPPGRQAADLLVRGGTVVNEDGSGRADVLIRGNTIVAVGPDLSAPAGTRVLDATGRLVLPGGIDPHTHLSPPFVDDFTSGSRAALAGGITTLGTFAFPGEGENALDAMDRYEARVAEEAVADVILHAFTWPPDPDFRALLPALAERGQPSLKLFMLSNGFDARMEDVVLLLEAARDAGVLTMIHCEDGPLLDAAARRLEAAGQTGLEHFAASRPVVAEVAATQRAAALCEATGAPMYVVHLSSARALDAVRNPATEGLPLFVESRPLYLHLTEERFLEPDGAVYVGQPPLRTGADAEALWRGLADGRIDVLATDHAPWTREQKLDPELSITRLRPGTNNLQVMLPMYFSEGVVGGRIDLQRFVATTASNPARLFGLYPRKGVIREGALADVVVWDPERTAVVSGADALSNAGFSVYEGWEVTGWPEVTVRRGEVVFEAGRVVGRPGTGALLSREPWT